MRTEPEFAHLLPSDEANAAEVWPEAVAATRRVGAAVEGNDLAEGDIVEGSLEDVVEEHQGEAGEALDLLLVGEEVVEAGDGGGLVPLHRARAVEEEGDLGDGFLLRGSGFRFLAHGGSLPHGVGQTRTAPIRKTPSPACHRC